MLDYHYKPCICYICYLGISNDVGTCAHLQDIKRGTRALTATSSRRLFAQKVRPIQEYRSNFQWKCFLRNTLLWQRQTLVQSSMHEHHNQQCSNTKKAKRSRQFNTTQEIGYLALLLKIHYDHTLQYCESSIFNVQSNIMTKKFFGIFFKLSLT